MTEEEELKGGEVRFTANPKLLQYLLWLSRNSILGASPGDVVRQIVVQRLSEMKGEDLKMPDKL